MNRRSSSQAKKEENESWRMIESMSGEDKAKEEEERVQRLTGSDWLYLTMMCAMKISKPLSGMVVKNPNPPALKSVYRVVKVIIFKQLIARSAAVLFFLDVAPPLVTYL